MAKIWFLIYNIFIIPTMYIGFRIAGVFNKKIKDGIKGRKKVFKTLADTFAKIDNNRKIILIHCVSVGEWEQAFPIITKLKESDPDLFIIVSFFSPSGYNYVKENTGIDLKIYLPFDGYFRMKKFLNMITPDLMIVSKHDVWPNLMFAAGELNIQSVLIDAALPSNSRRIKGLNKLFNRHVYNKFSMIYPISLEDKERFLQLYPFPDKIIVTGDTRFDQVYSKGQKAKTASEIKLFTDDSGIKFIAGSIWPSDEKHLMPAIIKLLHKYKELKAILVPHEPEESHLQDIENTLSSSSLESERYSSFSKTGKSDSRIVIIDTIGILAGLYADADLAFVGGSFGPGVHNVMEPAVLGLPVLFGPKYLNSFEAAQLSKHGGGYAVNNEKEIEDKLDYLISDNEKRKDEGEKAAKLISDNLGSTDRILKNLKGKYDFISISNTA